jgi:uncharacterized membrane protein
MKRSPRLTLLVLAVVSLASLLAAAPAFAQSKSLYWQRYDVDIAVQASGDMQVKEIQEIQFTSGTFTQGFAVIPRANTDSITDFAVHEGDHDYAKTSGDTGEPYTFYVQPVGSDYEVYWNFPETGPGVHTYELVYTVKGAIRQYPEGAELQWKAVSSERDFAANSSTVTVHLPPDGFPIEGRIVAFSPAQIEWSVPDATTVVFTSTRALRAGEGIEVGVAFNPAAITGPKPQWQQKFDAAESQRSLLQLLSLVLTGATIILVPLILFGIWWLFGRDPSTGTIPEYITEPPSDLPPGVIGTLIDERADTPDVVATLVDLARKGALTIEEQTTEGPFKNLVRKYVLQKGNEPEGLAQYEQTLYKGLFASGNTRKMDSLSGSLYSTFQNIQRQLYDEVVKRGLFKANPDKIRARYRALGIAGIITSVALFCIVVIGLASNASFFTCIPVVLGLGSIALIVLANYMPAKTRQGAEEAARWRAFQKFLANIEKYKDLKEATDLFEKYLPYAVAFGLDRKWVMAFSRVEATPVPRWYVPRYGPVIMPGGPGRMVGIPAGVPGAGKVEAAPAGLPGAGGAPAPSLSGMGQNLAGGLQSFSDGMVTMLNTTARTLNIQPTPTYTGSGSRGSTFGGSFTRTGSRGFSGGSFRHSGGGFRMGGGGGGGHRGFR